MPFPWSTSLPTPASAPGGTGPGKDSGTVDIGAFGLHARSFRAKATDMSSSR
jgi:hypothetical protein